jgi:carboxypeptidase family protein
MLSTKVLSRIFNALVSILIVGTCLSCAYAQIPKTTLQGRILDPAGAPVAGARITVSRESLASGITTASDKAGEFSIALAPGDYTLKVRTQGFLEVSRTLTLKESGAEPIEIVLQIATQRDTVTVSDIDIYQAPIITSGTSSRRMVRCWSISGSQVSSVTGTMSWVIRNFGDHF